jgi:Lanthionine synthetase C-like protein
LAFGAETSRMTGMELPETEPLPGMREADWPRSARWPGLAHGWQGPAWVVFQHERAGHPFPARIGARIARSLEAEVAKPVADGHCGLLVGAAAEAVLAAYAVRSGLVEERLLERACRRLTEVAETSRRWDVNVGAGGALLAYAEMEAVLPGLTPGALVRRLGKSVLAATQEVFRPGTGGWCTGMAHGLAGGMLAIETAVRLGGARLSQATRQRFLDTLIGAALGTSNGGILWPEVAEGDKLGLQAWCHGTPGVTLALLALDRWTGDAAYRELALRGLLGMEVLAEAGGSNPTLCCGRAGLGHIFLEGFRRTGETRWLAAARRLAQTGEPRFRPHRLGLFKGTLGWTYLQQRVAEPLAYPMPGLGQAA